MQPGRSPGEAVWFSPGREPPGDRGRQVTLVTKLLNPKRES